VYRAHRQIDEESRMTDAECTAFGPLTILYDPQGLHPRDWTTMQSHWAADVLRELPDGDVLELCAGVGHIGLLALVEADDPDRGAPRRLVQVDDDETVCRLAQHNAEVAGLGGRVDVRKGVAEDCLDPEERFALVIADPPWVPSDRVGDHPDDPPAAIDGGADGLEVVRALLPVIERHLVGSGAALLQVGGPDQVAAVGEILASTGSALTVAESRPAPGSEDGAVALLVPSGSTDPASDVRP
jgi:methylase of polypeptide subunit release factors